MMQGDECALGIQITNNGGSPVTPEDILDLEITLGRLRKSYKNAQLFYENGLWFFPLTQQETFGMPAANLDAQVRVRWLGGAVEGQSLMGVSLRESLSREVL